MTGKRIFPDKLVIPATKFYHLDLHLWGLRIGLGAEVPVRATSPLSVAGRPNLPANEFMAETESALLRDDNPSSLAIRSGNPRGASQNFSGESAPGEIRTPGLLFVVAVMILIGAYF